MKKKLSLYNIVKLLGKFLDKFVILLYVNEQEDVFVQSKSINRDAETGGLLWYKKKVDEFQL